MHGRLAALFFLVFAPQGAFVPLFSLRLQEMGFTPVEIGWAAATQAMAGLLSQFLVSQIADRWCSTEKVLTACGLIGSVLLWLLSSAETPWQVCLCTFGFWLAFGPATTLTSTICFAHLKHPAKDFSRIRLFGTLGWMCAGWTLGYVLSRPAWLFSSPGVSDLSDVFRFSGLLALSFAIYTLSLPSTPPAKKHTTWLAPIGAFRLLKRADFATFIGCSFFVSLTYPFGAQMAGMLLRALGVPPEWVSPALTVSQSMELLSMAMLPAILGRFGLKSTLGLGLTAWLIMFGVLAIGEPLALVVAALSLHGLCISCYWTAGQVFINERASIDIRASAQAMLSFFNCVGGLCGHLLAGWVRRMVDGRFSPTFAVAFGFCVVMVAVFYNGFRQHPKDACQRMAA